MKAVIAQSFERIHRSNLVGMGVVPFVFEEGTTWASLDLKETKSLRSMVSKAKSSRVKRRSPRSPIATVR